MTTFSKIMYCVVFISGILSISINLAGKNYELLGWAFSSTVWAALSLLLEMRCTSLERKIEDLKKQ